jgi:hypothetical protein
LSQEEEEEEEEVEEEEEEVSKYFFQRKKLSPFTPTTHRNSPNLKLGQELLATTSVEKSHLFNLLSSFCVCLSVDLAPNFQTQILQNSMTHFSRIPQQHGTLRRVLQITKTLGCNSEANSKNNQLPKSQNQKQTQNSTLSSSSSALKP